MRGPDKRGDPDTTPGRLNAESPPKAPNGAIVTDSTGGTLLGGASFPIAQDVAAELAVLDGLLDATGLWDSGR